MIRSIIEYLNTEIEILGKFNLYGLTDIFTRYSDETISFPAVYRSCGESDAPDFGSALSYHRLTGEIAIEEIESETDPSVERTETYPMRLVLFFKKDIYMADDAYIAIGATKNVANLLGTNNIASLAEDFQLSYVAVKVNSIEVHSEAVWADEFTNVKYSIPSDCCLTAIDYEIEARGNKDCFLNIECGDWFVSVRDLLSTVVLDENGDVIIQVLPGNNYTINLGSLSVQYIWATLPASGTNIVDVNGSTVGTWTDASQISISALSGKSLDEYQVIVDGTRLKWANTDDNINDIDDSLSTGGTIKLFTGRDLFQRGAELFIQI